ncbi:MAG TPA: glutaredoxin domain-containing protein [Anaerolineaceae bacterium]|nr:NrdH-redoxin [Anaerolineaceae bacterium]HOE35383.1 glutaredoxin domain-containing protein [Anaerolineaceae bacterium]HOT26073.1 glutaredoxin domain-containing protein [Anaerolineaceae bacterium]HQK03915.1 glutaredoxin domain-containing protein [Anaerolineaceae bacterium]HQL28226.1 glutaredoxin domain-containing protein [Anaerolineaceae bacterium]
MNTENRILFYGVNWCGDCKRSKRVFSDMQVPYVWFDLDENPRAVQFVKSVNQGMRRVPTIVFPDGTMLVEPRDDVLRAKLLEYQS